MTPEAWSAVDRYYADLLLPADEALEAALRDSRDAGLPDINVTPLQGKLLQLLALTQNVRRILEVGTLGGYSAIWLGRSLPAAGKMITLELEVEYARVARKNLERAGLAGIVEIIQGPALDSLKQLHDQGVPPFDLVFIDANKENTADYFQWGMKLSRPGTLIVLDNVVREGEVINAASTDTRVQGIRRFNEALAREQRVAATAIQTVGGKKWDGFVLARVMV